MRTASRAGAAQFLAGAPYRTELCSNLQERRAALYGGARHSIASPGAIFWPVMQILQNVVVGTNDPIT